LDHTRPCPSLKVSLRTRYASLRPRYIKVKVEHYLLFMFSPPKISWVVLGIKYICLHLLPVFYLIQPSNKQLICFVLRKKNSVLPILFYVPWLRQRWRSWRRWLSRKVENETYQILWREKKHFTCTKRTLMTSRNEQI
jgi:hypothetical protein